MDWDIEQYRTAVRTVPCPHCGALPEGRCVNTSYSPDRPEVDYVHDDRSLVFHELTATDLYRQLSRIGPVPGLSVTQEPSDDEVCPMAPEEGGPHDWSFRSFCGNDPYVRCARCRQIQDAITGRVIHEGGTEG